MSTVDSEPTDYRSLSEREFQLLQRLLGDPLLIPIQFKTWLVSYLEGSDLTVPLDSVLGLRSLLGLSGTGTGTVSLLPAGVVFPYAGATAPAGSLLCNGASYLRADQPRLFAAIGVTYGAVDGTHFNVPNIPALPGPPPINYIIIA